MLGRVKENLKSALPWLARFVWWMKRRITELSALHRHLIRRIRQRDNRIHNEGVIKVVFLCQYIPAWSKNKQLYETLKSDRRFETCLLCVPNRISANQLREPDDQSNDTYEYFCGQGYSDAVNALIGKNEWLDLKSWHPDYVICNRYDRPMPIPYTSGELSKYMKICFITYSGVALLERDEVAFDKHFMANTFCFFAESEGKEREYYRCNKILGALKLCRAVRCGSPAVENMVKAKNDKGHAWDFSENGFRAIYAPRWTQDPTWGGSSFLEYGNSLIHFADEHSDLDLLIRPHPLMFDHFVDTAVMTEKEVADFAQQCDFRKNVKLDTEKEYHSTFWNSSALICDFSSIIVEYYVTEKPIIYLTFDEKIGYTEQMLAMLSGCYIVHSKAELEQTIEQLLAGRDPLAQRRSEVCRKYLAVDNNATTSEKMKQALIDGYSK